MSSSSVSSSSSSPHRIFTKIPLLQRIALFSAVAPKAAVKLALINDCFHETMIVFRTSTMIWKKFFSKRSTSSHSRATKFSSSSAPSSSSVAQRPPRRITTLIAFLQRCAMYDVVWPILLLLVDNDSNLVPPSLSLQLFQMPKRDVARSTSPSYAMYLENPLVLAVKASSKQETHPRSPAAYKVLHLLLDFMVEKLNSGYRHQKPEKDNSSAEEALQVENENPTLAKARNDYHLACYFLKQIAGHFSSESRVFLDAVLSHRDKSESKKVVQLILSKLELIKPASPHASRLNGLDRQFFMSRTRNTNDTMLHHLVYTRNAFGRYSQHFDREGNEHRKADEDFFRWILEEAEKRNFLKELVMSKGYMRMSALMMSVMNGSNHFAFDILIEKIEQLSKINNETEDLLTKSLFQKDCEDQPLFNHALHSGSFRTVRKLLEISLVSQTRGKGGMSLVKSLLMETSKRYSKQYFCETVVGAVLLKDFGERPIRKSWREETLPLIKTLFAFCSCFYRDDFDLDLKNVVVDPTDESSTIVNLGRRGTEQMLKELRYFTMEITEDEALQVEKEFRERARINYYRNFKQHPEASRDLKEEGLFWDLSLQTKDVVCKCRDWYQKEFVDFKGF